MTRCMATPSCSDIQPVHLTRHARSATSLRVQKQGIKMKHDMIKNTGAWLVMALALGFCAPSQAASVDADGKPKATKTRKKSGASGQIKFLPGSAETTKERSSRLMRECKGRVNAGACAGYTY